MMNKIFNWGKTVIKNLNKKNIKKILKKFGGVKIICTFV